MAELRLHLRCWATGPGAPAAAGLAALVLAAAILTVWASIRSGIPRRAERRHREREGVRRCQRCRGLFTATALHQRYCSKACRLAAGHAMKVTAGRAATRIGQEAHA